MANIALLGGDTTITHYSNTLVCAENIIKNNYPISFILKALNPFARNYTTASVEGQIKIRSVGMYG